MKKTLYSTLLLIGVAAPIALADEPADAFRLIYPASAASEEPLDSTTPYNRATPPAREDEEFDPVTPIGQIRYVLESLNAVKTQNESILAKIGKIQTDKTDVSGLATSQSVESLVLTTKNVGAKLDDLKKTTENLRATVESVQKTVASVERIRTSRWTNYAVIAILALVIVQLAWRVGATLVGWIKGRAVRVQELMAALEVAKQQLAEAKKEVE